MKPYNGREAFQAENLDIHLLVGGWKDVNNRIPGRELDGVRGPGPSWVGEEHENGTLAGSRGLGAGVYSKIAMGRGSLSTDDPNMGRQRLNLKSLGREHRGRGRRIRWGEYT